MREYKVEVTREGQLAAPSTERTKEYGDWLVAEGVPVRDVAELLGPSPQRVSQITNAESTER